jgi:hypothetical protein
MAVRNGLKTTRISLNSIPNTQISGQWVGNYDVITLLDKGIYICNYTVAYYPSVGGQITNSQTILTKDLPDIGGGHIISCSPLTGTLGLGVNEAMRQSLCNTFVITQDNTAIYLYLSCTLGGGTWGTTNALETNLNVINFTKLSSL